ncbi:MAG TPA: beta-ketoacyl-[acyl-carrier-protein] synthase II [Rectinemataceae bacterium]|nr:beta-ketoacyl-[acyl-carrier-protein] synthase II [Rectinemataceae bacterium]
MQRKIAVTGLGVISPIGNDMESFWGALLRGESGAGPVTRFDASRLDSKIAAEVKGFDPGLWMDKKESRKMGLFSQYAVAASVQAWRDAGLADEGFRATGGEAAAAMAGSDVIKAEGGADAARMAESRALSSSYDGERTAICLGNGIGGLEVFQDSHAKLLESGPDRMPPMTVPLMIANEAAANVAMRLGIRGPAYTQVTACASGTDAIGQAIDLLRSGRADIVVAGGTEAAITEFAMGGFCRLKALTTRRNDEPKKASRPFDADRDGFLIGEGAGIMILEDYERAKARGARIYALASGYGATCDAYHLTAPHPEGIQGSRALALALEDAGLKPSEVGYYNAHGTSTQLNDPTETAMVKKTFGDAVHQLKISSTKSMTGHCLGATGAIEAIVCVKAIETGYLPPTINLDNPDIAAGCDLDYIPNKAIHHPIEAALTASLGFGGHNGALAFRRA